MNQPDKTLAGPFLKWAGGKGQILPHIERIIPKNISRYFEPFLGGGAVFFRLYSLGLIKKTFLGDANPYLIITYGVVRDFPEELMSRLEELKAGHDESQYYDIRERFNFDEITDLERAAELIYLNKTCFNGLYRVNSKGHFNVPAGRYVNPGIYDRELLLACSRALNQASVACGDFEAVVSDAGPGDFVYFDPPYVPLSKTASFTSYARDNFTFSDQERLAATFKKLAGRGAKVLLSNHATPELIDLFDGFKIAVVPARRMINKNAARRKNPVDEVLIRNY